MGGVEDKYKAPFATVGIGICKSRWISKWKFSKKKVWKKFFKHDSTIVESSGSRARELYHVWKPRPSHIGFPHDPLKRISGLDADAAVAHPSGPPATRPTIGTSLPTSGEVKAPPSSLKNAKHNGTIIKKPWSNPKPTSTKHCAQQAEINFSTLSGHTLPAPAMPPAQARVCTTLLPLAPARAKQSETKQSTTKHTQPSKPASEQANEQTNEHTNKPNQQTNEKTNQQTKEPKDQQTNERTNEQAWDKHQNSTWTSSAWP